MGCIESNQTNKQTNDSGKNLLGTISECETAWIQIKTDILSVMIWVQTVCKGYQKTIKFTTSRERVNRLRKSMFDFSQFQVSGTPIKLQCLGQSVFWIIFLRLQQNLSTGQCLPVL